MPELIVRVADLVVGGARITSQRVVFSVQRSLSKTPNTCDVKVWNLTERTRTQIQAKGTAVILTAGYEGESGIIFSGDSRTTDHTFERGGVVTRVQCGDGEKAYAVTYVSESWSPGTQLVDVLSHLIRALGYNPGNALARLRRGDFRAGFTEFPHGYVTTGRAVDELDRLLRSAGLTWSIQDGALQVLKANEVLADEVVLLSSSSGLIGSPAYNSPDKQAKASVLKARSLLRHVYRPGRKLQLKSRGVSGVFKIEKVTHTGDTHGQDWYSDLEMLPCSNMEVV